MYVIGDVVGAQWFTDCERLYCRWRLVDDYGNKKTDNCWTLLSGTKVGVTQIASARDGNVALWSHPIDVRYSLSAIDGWPRFFCEVWKIDKFDRHEIAGYGYCLVPTEPGERDIECVTWRPIGNAKERLREFFIGSNKHLKDSSVVYRDINQKFPLQTQTTGIVHLRLCTMTRGLDACRVSVTKREDEW